MADNVNIIVQDTINDIVVNAAQIVETIDINVQAAVDVVDIVANPNNYVVNINRIIGEQVQSDWNQSDNQAPDYIKNKPTIPASQVNSDWNATSGVAEILNKPTIPPAVTIDTVPTDGSANAVSSNGTFDALATKYNNPTGTTAQYIDGTGAFQTFPTTLPAENLQTYGRNSTGATLYRGTIVYISGSTGFRPNFTKAQANSESTSARTFGVILDDIANNADGYVVNIGSIDNLDTRSTATHPFTTDTLADGDTVYLSPTTAGYITNVKPYAPNHLVYIGKVIRTSPTNGTIVYQIQNGYELDELHNVSAQTPSNNDGLFYESSTSLWKNKPIATVLGYTPVTNARTISTTAPLSGGGDLSADRTLSISQATTSTNGYLSSTDWNTFNGKFTLPSLTSGSVLFSNGTTIAQDNANLFWDDTNNRLGIGTNAPATALDVNGTARVQGDFSLVLGNSIRFGVALGMSKSNAAMSIYGGTSAGAAGTNDLYYWNGSSYVVGFRLNNNSNILIGTTTDAGYKLDVNGTARVQGTTTLQSILPQTTQTYSIGSGTNQFSTIYSNVFQSNGTGIVRGGGNLIMQVSGGTEAARFAITTGNLLIGTTTDIASSKLTIESTTQGFLPPRMTTTQKNAIATPAAGLVVYDTTLGKLCVRTAANWETITSV